MVGIEAASTSIIGQSGNFGSQHRKTASRRGARKAHQPRFIDAQMVNSVHEDHARRMRNPARHVETRPNGTTALWEA